MLHVSIFFIRTPWQFCLGWHLIFGDSHVFPFNQKTQPINPSSHSFPAWNRLCFFGDVVRINVVHSITQASISTIPTATACILESFWPGKKISKKKQTVWGERESKRAEKWWLLKNTWVNDQCGHFWRIPLLHQNGVSLEYAHGVHDYT